MLEMADSAGYFGRIISLAWKVQSEPETVIGEYAENQKKGSSKVRSRQTRRFGDAHGILQYYFYRASALEAVFGDITAAAAARRAEQIEQSLHHHRLDAEAAIEQYHAGVEIGHTVCVMASVFKEYL